MRKFYLLAGCVLSLIAIVEVFPFPTASANLQEPNDSDLGKPGASRFTQISWETVLDSMFKRQEPKDGGPGRRGVARLQIQTTRSRDPNPEPASVCLITPNRIESANRKKDTTLIWNTRPLFVWQGTVQDIVVVVPGNPSVLRQATSLVKEPSGLNYLPFEGDSLQPGQTYRFSFLSPKKQKYVAGDFFQVMNDRDRAAITRDLQDLEKTLRKTNATKEAIALQRANYFARRDMLADMLQEMYSVENPSDELKKALRETQAEICP